LASHQRARNQNHRPDRKETICERQQRYSQACFHLRLLDVSRGPKAYKVQRAILVLKEIQARKVKPVLLDRKVCKAFKVQPGPHHNFALSAPPAKVLSHAR